MEAWTFGLQVRDIYKKFVIGEIRLYIAYNLIFFFLSLAFSCRQSAEKKIRIRWNGEKADGIFIPKSLTGDVPADSIANIVSVQRNRNGQDNAILGNFSTDSDLILFEPLIPFTPGMQYKIFARKKPVGLIEIPMPDASGAPSVTSIFPSADTLPDNLLKVYIQFSKPMREGKSAENIALIKHNNDTVSGAFLDLQPELWNQDRTRLTLWLDPGRIKRDLQPNKLLGAPLRKNSDYRIVISRNWQDEQGARLSKEYSKKFITSGRDSLSPDPELWKIKLPAPATNQPVAFQFNEPIDYSLLNECLSIRTSDGKSVSGRWEILNQERGCHFIPDDSWSSGHYLLFIETRLEDLAGNNINRLFDRDITVKAINKSSDFTKIKFQIK